MTDYINEYLRSTNNEMVRPHIVMIDGTTLNVQASQYHWCKPREHHLTHYDAVEVWGFPVDETYFVEWGGNSDNPASCVPVAKVNEYIEQHGGLVIK